MYNLTVKLKSGESIMVECLHSVRLISNAAHSVTIAEEKDFHSLLPSEEYGYIFIGTNEIFSIAGINIQFFFFSKQT